MTKRLILSFAIIAMALVGVTGATYAYFSAGQVLGSNTFATGSVALGGFNVGSLNVSGLVPGVTVDVPNIDINYTGNVNADLYIGARGTGWTPYLADKLYLQIYTMGGAFVWQGWVKDLSDNWEPIGTNIINGWQAYDLKFTLDTSAGNSYNGVTNTDTQIMVYAVQHSGLVPTTPPWQTAATPDGSGHMILNSWILP